MTRDLLRSWILINIRKRKSKKPFGIVRQIVFHGINFFGKKFKWLIFPAVNFNSRKIKATLRVLLVNNDWESLDSLIQKIPPRKLVNPLFSFFYDLTEVVKWRSITMTGRVVARLAENDFESARVVMRRLIWNLNDESGGIGWGSAEAMGEIMALSDGLAGEYAGILRSFIRKDENYLEHEILQRGAIWGIGRLAQTRLQYLNHTDFHLLGFLQSKDAVHRGFAAWALGNFRSESAVALLQKLRLDDEKIFFYNDLQLNAIPVCRLASEALDKIKHFM